MKRIGLIVITALLFFWLSACGGSSSNSSSNTNPATGGSSPAAGAQNPGTGSGGTSSGGSSTSALAYVAGSNQSFFGIRVDSSSNISTVSGSPYSLSGNLDLRPPGIFSSLLLSAPISPRQASPAIALTRTALSPRSPLLRSAALGARGLLWIRLASSCMEPLRQATMVGRFPRSSVFP